MSSTRQKVAVVGASGRMGREVLRALTPAYGFEVVAAVDRTEIGVHLQELAGPTAPDLVIEEKLGNALDRSGAEVLVDFSHARAAASHATSALSRKIPVVIGCTGLTDGDMSTIRSEVREQGVPVLVVPNFAIGAVLMMKFSEMAAAWLPDAEIIELHHDRKEDAPSGTAMRTAEMIAAARKQDPVRKPKPLIKAEGARGGVVGSVNIHSIRLPGLLAHQEVIFGGLGETLTIRHDSADRIGFMPGVRLAVQRVPGLSGLIVGLDKILFE